MSELDSWYVENLICPADGQNLQFRGNFLLCSGGHRYPIVEGMPVMLRGDVRETIGVARTSLEIANSVAAGGTESDAPLYADTLGVTDEERTAARQLQSSAVAYDPVVAVMIGATSGSAYKHLIGASASYPIPSFRFPTPTKGRLLDIGCNWGRWTVAAARAGHEAIGIDPQLGAVLAARRVSRQLGTPARFVVGDARYLPFRPGYFDYAWSYSVLQHFSRENAKLSLTEIARIVRPDGCACIQMANALGARSFYHIVRRRFRAPINFEVRYWTPSEMKRVFQTLIGPTKLDADCFLGLGLQWSDFARMSATGKAALYASEFLRLSSGPLLPLRWFADSLFCTARVGSRPEGL